VIQFDNVTFKVAEDRVPRKLFQQYGTLDNQRGMISLPPKASHLANSSTFAISRDLGIIQATQDPVVWAVGYTADSVINYTDPSEAPPQQRCLYYKTQYFDDGSLVGIHIHH